MDNKKQSLSKECSQTELSSYFELQACWGITKHMGGLKATRELIKLCHIKPIRNRISNPVNNHKYILDVGCGVGVSACYIAKMCGCRVVGVDISRRMIHRSNERAKREGVWDRVEFRVADAQNLPFEDATFDAVMSESVIVFLRDKQRAIEEYVRVTKPGGCVGINEATWIKAPPPELVEYFSRAMPTAEFLNSNEGKELLEGSGLREIVVKTYKTNAPSQWINEVRQLDILDFLRAWDRFLFQWFKSSALRRWTRELWPPPRSIFNIFRYLGYTMYAGRK